MTSFLAVRSCWVALAVCVLSSGGIHADPPTGLYCSCPPTTANSHSVLPDVAALPYVDGTLVRVGWADIEPSPGVYDWSLLDAELARAELYDTDVALAVVLGRLAPAWLEGLGAEVFEYSRMGVDEQMIVPWDPVLLQHLVPMIGALGERYDGHPRIKLVHITHSTANGFEMQLGGTLTAWQQIGYTTQRHADSWFAVLDAYNLAFPATALDVDVHPVLGSSDIAAMVVAHGRATMQSRFGVFAAWWTTRNANDVYPDMYDILVSAGCDPFAAVQVARSETTHGPDSFGEGGLEGTLGLALDSGIGYAEVWNNDLLNPALQPAIRAYASGLVSVSCEPACPADTNSDGLVTPQDFNAWVIAFNGQQPACDQNGDGLCAPNDFSAWVQNYNAGCP